MRIYYSVRDLSQMHSCMYNMLMLKDLGHELIPILGFTTDELNSILVAHGITVKYYSLRKQLPHWKYFILNNYHFIRQMKKGLRDLRDDDVIFVGTADSALYSFPLFINKRYVICLLEMHENQRFLQRVLKLLCSKAEAVICCEINRARYAQFKWKLNSRPYVVSNKPYGVSQPTEISSELSVEINKRIAGRKSILYQAWHIHQTDVLLSLIRALAMLKDNIVLVVMGIVDPCVDVESLEKIYSSIIWMGHIHAPNHLAVTKQIDIGVAMYSEKSLNNLFCAPNKTFEYSCFGKPVLCNDIPGLIETIGINNAGVCVAWDNPSMIAYAIKRIFSNYDYYSNNAKAFYGRENNLKELKRVIEDLEN